MNPSSPIFASSARRPLRVGLVALMGVAGSVGGFWGTASATPASHPQRSVSAPADVLTLAYYAVQPPDPPEGDEGGEEDSTNVDRDFKSKQPPAGQPGNTPGGDPFSTQDTTRQGNVPVVSPFDTLGQAATRPLSGSAATAAPPSGSKSRRGILGLHPAALLIGLVALHIFVVTTAAK